MIRYGSPPGGAISLVLLWFPWWFCSDIFCLYFIKKYNWGGLMGRYLREVITNQPSLNSPPPLLIPEFIIYLLIKSMFGVFTLAMKFDCLFVGHFSKFLLIGDFTL